RFLNAQDGDETARWAAILKLVPWNRGDVARGEAIFQQRACAACHASKTPIGPDLAGAAQRFSRDDLFAAILFPNRDIAPAYRTTTFRLRDGEVYTGLVAFESADGY